MTAPCTYCREPVDSPIYDATCLLCTAALMRPFTDGVIFRRLEIVWREHGEALARRLCDAIERARAATEAIHVEPGKLLCSRQREARQGRRLTR